VFVKRDCPRFENSYKLRWRSVRVVATFDNNSVDFSSNAEIMKLVRVRYLHSAIYVIRIALTAKSVTNIGRTTSITQSAINVSSYRRYVGVTKRLVYFFLKHEPIISVNSERNAYFRPLIDPCSRRVYSL